MLFNFFFVLMFHVTVLCFNKRKEKKNQMEKSQVLILQVPATRLPFISGESEP